jgi:hypothetical protein
LLGLLLFLEAVQRGGYQQQQEQLVRVVAKNGWQWVMLGEELEGEGL